VASVCADVTQSESANNQCVQMAFSLVSGSQYVNVFDVSVLRYSVRSGGDRRSLVGGTSTSRER
jgi:hypothetical protein